MSWLAPTVRLVRWWSLLVPVVAASVLGGMIRVHGLHVPTTVALYTAAALAAAVPASLDDAAHELLGPVPTTWRRRVLQRLTIVVPAVAAAWFLAILAMLGVDGDPMPSTVGVLDRAGDRCLVYRSKNTPGHRRRHRRCHPARCRGDTVAANERRSARRDPPMARLPLADGHCGTRRCRDRDDRPRRLAP